MKRVFWVQLWQLEDFSREWKLQRVLNYKKGEDNVFFDRPQDVPAACDLDFDAFDGCFSFLAAAVALDLSLFIFVVFSFLVLLTFLTLNSSSSLSSGSLKSSSPSESEEEIAVML